MQDYQREFLDFAIANDVLRFGDFTLKSGRNSPYFFNSGLFNTGQTITLLGRYYADAIVASGIKFDMLFGPAYKGIPLAVAASIGLYDKYQISVPYAFNRKEAKDHGEGGVIVGAALQGKVLVIDDVISAGTSVRESSEIIQHEGATLTGVAISLDRQERGTASISAIEEIEKTFQIKVTNIANLDILIQYLEEKPDMSEVLTRILAYQSEYGCKLD